MGNLMRTLTRNGWFILPSLLLTGALGLPAGAVPAPASTTSQAAEPAPSLLLRAQYQWGYAGADGQGKGTLSVLIEPASGHAILELQGLGERLMLLEGDSASGYRVQIPRQKLDERAASLAAIPLPFFPQVSSAEALYQMLAEGTGAGVKVTRRDPSGPVKMRYQGVDERGKELLVWLERTRWELSGKTAKAPKDAAAAARPASSSQSSDL